jgi:hypothetical protein
MFGKSDVPFVQSKSQAVSSPGVKIHYTYQESLHVVTLEKPLPAAVDGVVVWRGVALCYRIGMACLVHVDPEDR